MDCSVIIVTKNRVNKLERCINSIFNCTLLPSEIIIIDNCSNDSTKKVINKLKKENKCLIKYLKKEGTLPEIRNYGLRLSSKEIAIFLDDDCVVNSDWIKNILNYHKLFPKVIAISGYSGNFKDNLISKSVHIFRIFQLIYDLSLHINNNIDKLNIRKNIYNKISLSTQNISFKKKLIKNIKFNKNLLNAEDGLFGLEIYQINQDGILFIPKIKVLHENISKFSEIFPKYYSYGKYSSKLKKIIKKNKLKVPIRKKRFKIMKNYLLEFIYETKNYNFIFKLTILFFLILLKITWKIGEIIN